MKYYYEGYMLDLARMEQSYRDLLLKSNYRRLTYKMIALAEKIEKFIISIKDIKPIYLRIYYISVENTRINDMFYQKWVELWLTERELCLDYILRNNNNSPVIDQIPEPWAPYEENKFPLSTEIKEMKFIMVYSEIPKDKSLCSIFNTMAICVVKGELILKDNILDRSFSLDIFNYPELRNISYLRFLFNELLSTKNLLEAVNIERGFVSTINIYSKDYPIIRETAIKVISPVNYEKLNNINKCKCYIWIINIILLNIYEIAERALSIIGEVPIDSPNYFEHMDILTKFLIIKSWSYNLLDNCIKQHLRKTKPIIMQENIVGYDTEYIPKNIGRNELLSVQLSICAVTKIKIPLLQEFKFEGVNTTSGETYMKEVPKFDEINLVRSWINNKIIEVRKHLHQDYDERIRKLINLMLIHDDHFESIVKTDINYIFKLHKPSINNIFIKAAEGEKLIIDFETLVNIIENSCKVQHIKLLNEVMLIANSFDKRLKAEIYSLEDKNCEPWNNDTLKQNPCWEIILSNEKNDMKRKEVLDKDIKSVITKAITFNYNKKTYLYSHYNAADLSLIRNWAEVCEMNVDIIKKSFNSLVKPIVCSGKFVYLRDTILLASAVAGTLDAIGKMHKMEKGKLSQYEYENMDILMNKNIIKFRAYAMQDSLITLIHGLFMNDFNFRLGSTRNPSTLGSISTLYVKGKWKADKYRGYQVDANYPLGNVQTSLTPRGITSLGKIGEELSLYIGSFRGGRNECYTYGIDKTKVWYDYDLSSCYSTIMSMCGNPNYEKIEFIRELERSEGDVESAEKSRSFADTMAKFRSEFKRQASLLEVENLPEDVPRDSSVPSVASSLEEVQPEKNSSLEEFSIENYFNKKIIDQKDQLLEEEVDELSKISPAVLAMCGDPDYSKSISLNHLSNIKELDFVNSYSALRVAFNFPNTIQYPPIPVNLDKNITVYPLQGETLITGIEYITAKRILNKALIPLAETRKDLEMLEETFFVKIISGSFIPFKKDENSYPPFLSIINELQANRRLHVKKSAMERIWKDLGNMLYGKIVSGISNKRKYDGRTRTITAMMGNAEFGNPIIGGWITGFVRSLLAELLNFVHSMGGKITAVTTDGFVTDIPDLENAIISSPAFDPTTSLLQKYRDIRTKLSGDPSALEVKTSVKGIIQWTTRGQLSYYHHDDPALNPITTIAAMTGFQKHQFTQEQNVNFVENVLNKGNTILFLQKELSGALDSYQGRNNHVTMKSSIRKFRTVFDNKRIITELIPATNLYDSKPYLNIEECKLNRTLMTSLKQKVYSEQYSSTLVSAPMSFKDQFLKYFIKFWSEKQLMNKEVLLLLCNEVFNIKDKYLMILINDALINKGTILSTLNPNKISASLFADIYELLNYKYKNNNFFNEFITKFYNFTVYIREYPLVPFVPQVLDIVPYVSFSEKYASIVNFALKSATALLSANIIGSLHPTINKFLINLFKKEYKPLNEESTTFVVEFEGITKTIVINKAIIIPEDKIEEDEKSFNLVSDETIDINNNGNIF